MDGASTPQRTGGMLGVITLLLLVGAGFYLLLAARREAPTAGTTPSFDQAIQAADCPAASDSTSCFDFRVTNDGSQTIQLNCVVFDDQAQVDFVFDTGEDFYQVGDLTPGESRTIGLWAIADRATIGVDPPTVTCNTG